jgi:hypothetical protein
LAATWSLAATKSEASVLPRQLRLCRIGFHLTAIPAFLTNHHDIRTQEFHISIDRRSAASGIDSSDGYCHFSSLDILARKIVLPTTGIATAFDISPIVLGELEHTGTASQPPANETGAGLQRFLLRRGFPRGFRRRRDCVPCRRIRRGYWRARSHGGVDVRALRRRHDRSLVLRVPKQKERDHRNGENDGGRRAIQFCT